MEAVTVAVVTPNAPDYTPQTAPLDTAAFNTFFDKC